MLIWFDERILSSNTSLKYTDSNSKTLLSKNKYPKPPRYCVKSFTSAKMCSIYGVTLTFEIPVSVFDAEMEVTADTVAMSEPHEIDYTLNFDSTTAKEAEKTAK